MEGDPTCFRDALTAPPNGRSALGKGKFTGTLETGTPVRTSDLSMSHYILKGPHRDLLINRSLVYIGLALQLSAIFVSEIMLCVQCCGYNFT